MNACRICLDAEVDLITISSNIAGTSEFIWSFASECLKVQIQLNDGLPQEICKDCSVKLKKIYEFREIALKSFNTLKLQQQFIDEKENLNNAQDESEMLDVEYLILDEESNPELSNDEAQENYDSEEQESFIEYIDDEQSEDVNNDENLTSLHDEIKKLHEEMDHVESQCQKSLGINASKNIKLSVDDSENDKLERCCGCFEKFHSLDSLLIHSKKLHKPQNETNHQNEEYQCEICYIQFKHEKALRIHRNFYRKTMECPICDAFYVSFDQKYQHALKTHNIQLDSFLEQDLVINCCSCLMTFKNYDQLIDHSTKVHAKYKIIDNSKLFECDVCFKKFTNEKGIKDHKTHAYHNRLRQCGECKQTFKGQNQLENHIKLHATSENTLSKFQCAYCPKSFNQKNYKDRHENVVHLKNKSYLFKCQDCQKEYKSKWMLKNHFRQHHMSEEERLFVCGMCSKKFSSKSYLDKHIKNHLGIKEYKCKYCTEEFVYYTDCKRHEMRRHTGKYQYKCDECQKPFLRLDACRKHKSTVHGNSEK